MCKNNEASIKQQQIQELLEIAKSINTYKVMDKRQDVLDQLRNQSEKYLENLKDKAQNGRSIAIRDLAQEQYKYLTECEFMVRVKLPTYLHCDDTTTQEDKEETAYLFKEFVWDLVAELIRKSLIAEIEAADFGNVK